MARTAVRRILVAIVVLAAFGYSAAIVHLMMREPELIFRTSAAPADTRPSFPYEQIDLPRSDGARQFAWRITPPAPNDAPLNGSDGLWVLYLHGNAATVASRMNVAHYGRLRELGVN